MKQYEIHNKTIHLKVKKSPAFIRGILFFIAFVSFVFPVLALLLGILWGGEIHIGYFIAVIFSGLIGFYLLRVSLWNTYGEETIKIVESPTYEIGYEANYGWFKDGRKRIHPKKLLFTIHRVGYEEDHIGTLIIGDEDIYLESVVKMPISQLEELIVEMEKVWKFR